MESIVHKLKNLASWENPLTSGGSWVCLNTFMLWVCLGNSSAFTSITNILLLYLIVLKIYLMSSKVKYTQDAFKDQKPLLSEEWLPKALNLTYDGVNQFMDKARNKCDKENVSRVAISLFMIANLPISIFSLVWLWVNSIYIMNGLKQFVGLDVCAVCDEKLKEVLEVSKTFKSYIPRASSCSKQD